MPKYCLDSDVFIQAKNGPYGFDIFPAFWNWLDTQFSKETVFSSKMVYDELIAGEDELSEWIHNRKETNYFINPNQNIQSSFQDIANFVRQKYPLHQVEFFLDGADPWVIAQAKAMSAIVITHEVPVSENSTKIKIPNICNKFKVKYLNLYQMMRALNARF